MLNFASEETRRNPFPIYDQIRSVSPVVCDPKTDIWMLFDYASVKQCISDHEAFTSSVSAPGSQPGRWFIFFDPPRHTKLRSLVMRAFTPKSVADLETRIREISRTLLDQHIERGQMDLATDYAEPLPMMVIAQMLGIPMVDWPRFRMWSEGILGLSYTVSAGGDAARAAREQYKVVTEEMAVYLRDLLEERQRSPKDDLLTRLGQAEVDGDRLTEDDVLGFFQLLLIAGTETTTNLINNAVLCFVANPGEFAKLQSNPALLTSATEEVLRYRSPVQWMFRVTTRDVEMRDRVIPAGRLVLPMIGSANCDPAHFKDAGRFEVTRDPNPHIAFGHGVHFCLGAPLARLEAKIALGDLIGRLNGLELASSEPWQPRSALHVHGPARLPIRFQAAQRLGSATAELA